MPAWTPALVNPKMFKTVCLKSPAADRKGLARNDKNGSMLGLFLVCRRYSDVMVFSKRRSLFWEKENREEEELDTI